MKIHEVLAWLYSLGSISGFDFANSADVLTGTIPDYSRILARFWKCKRGLLFQQETSGAFVDLFLGDSHNLLAKVFAG